MSSQRDTGVGVALRNENAISSRLGRGEAFEQRAMSCNQNDRMLRPYNRNIR